MSVVCACGGAGGDEWGSLVLLQLLKIADPLVPARRGLVLFSSSIADNICYETQPVDLRYGYKHNTSNCRAKPSS